MSTTSDRVRFENVGKRFHIRDGRTLKEALFSHQRPPFVALDDVSFTIRGGESLAVIGGNGSGKSTILRLIAHVMEPTAGSVWTSGHIAPLLNLHASFHPDLTGRENVFLNASMLGLSDRDARRALGDIVAFAEVEQFIDTPVKRYSSGMSVRLAFAVAVHSNPDILLVDEVLAVGDRSFQEKCFDRIRALRLQGVSIVFVSHVLEMVEAFCDRTLLLDAGKALALGPTSIVIARYLANEHDAAGSPSQPVEIDSSP